ncbi:MAG TPA: allophanate hydrolase [Dermatophilaceae bacterium]|nr:allophanate hydrolase [Dermatophilaceae bacterium]
MDDRDEPGPVRQPGIAQLRSDYLIGRATPAEVIERTLDVIRSRGDDGTWITLLEPTTLRRRAAELADTDPAAMPLYGIPFGVKDSIHVAGVPTTLACPDYASVPNRTAPAVQRLLDAGAILVGKTNLDQFATGLNGTRTPYTVPRSVYGRSLISGGSSSGSALAVASGEVPFALATDTAGSGRVPAALNGIVGFKPSRGLVSTVGLVPACRSLDCMSLMAGSVDDVAAVFDVVVGPDDQDPWSRPRGPAARTPDAVRVGLPDPAALEFFGDDRMRAAHLVARSVMAQAFECVPVDVGPFLEAGTLLYQGPWVVERVVEFGDFVASHPGSTLPVITAILQSAQKYTAADVFRAQYRLQALKARAAHLWTTMDVLVLPTIGTTFTVEEVLAEPIACNTRLGHYTHAGNLLDLCAAAIPCGATSDGRPAGVMLLGPAGSDDLVLEVAGRVLASSRPPTVDDTGSALRAVVPAAVGPPVAEQAWGPTYPVPSTRS